MQAIRLFASMEFQNGYLNDFKTRRNSLTVFPSATKALISPDLLFPLSLSIHLFLSMVDGDQPLSVFVYVIFVLCSHLSIFIACFTRNANFAMESFGF